MTNDKEKSIKERVIEDKRFGKLSLVDAVNVSKLIDLTEQLTRKKVAEEIFKEIEELECQFCGKCICCVDNETICEVFQELKKKFSGEMK